MCSVVVLLSIFLALIASADIYSVSGERKLMCQIQGDNNLECNLRKMLIGKKFYDAIRENENMATVVKPPKFICKGPSCVMKFKKSDENIKKTGGNEQKETTFYSGW